MCKQDKSTRCVGSESDHALSQPFNQQTGATNTFAHLRARQKYDITESDLVEQKYDLTFHG